MIVSLMFMFACGQADEKDTDDTGGDSGGSEPSQEPGAEPADEPSSEPSSEPSAEPAAEPGEGAPQRETCGPQPNDQAVQMAVDLFAKALEVEEQACFLERIDIDSDGDGISDSSEEFTAPAELTCDDPENCEQELPTFALAWSQHSENGYGLFGQYEDMYEGRVEGRRVITEGVENLELELSFELTGSTAGRRVERIYNEYGNMLQETYYFNGNRWFLTTNQWENGLLVAQELQDFINSNGGTSSLSWTYDDEDRMSSSSYTSVYGQHNTATFSYDEDGRLSELTRSLEGELWLTQTWTYDGAELVSRSNVLLGDNSWITGADNMVAISPTDYSSHWDQSLSTEEGGCVTPPLSLVYGYPDKDELYQLGWSRHDIPDRIGFAYGYSGYGWMYGDTSWFGHGGIAGMYDFLGYDGAQSTVTAIYEDGIMVEEQVEVVEAGQVTLSVARSRQVDAERIVSDEVTSTMTTDEGVDVQVELLSFTYDDDGRLTHRELFHNDSYVHQSTWSYDDAGHLIEHGIWGTGTLYNDPVDADGSDAELPHLSTYRQVITDDAQGYERIREQRDRDATEWLPVDSLRRGEHTLGEYEMRDDYLVVFDSQGQMVMTGNGDPENPEYYTVWTQDQNSLLSSWEEGGPESVMLRSYSHTCPQ